ncbi:MalY/PatB family protein [Propionibacteriaceae bacterium Y1685]
MTELIFDVPLDELRRRTSMKWQAFDADVLPAWVAEMDCRPAPAVQRVISDFMATGDTGYPAGSAGCAEAFADFAGWRWGWTPSVADTVVVPDVMQGVARALQLLTQPGDHVVINNPVYNCFYGFIPWAERQILEVPLGSDHRLDLAALERAFSGADGVKPTAYLLCNPHNPTGTLHTVEELTAVAELARRYDVAVVSDEIHAPLVAPAAGFVPWLTVDPEGRSVTVTSASKAWNLAGLKAALAIGTPQTAELLRTLPDEVTHAASYLGLIAHRTALTDGRDWLDRATAELEANRSHLHARLESELPMLKAVRGQATYLAWVDCSALGVADPSALLRTRGKVGFSTGANYGSGGDQHVRINFATSREILDEAIDRTVTAVGSR